MRFPIKAIRPGPFPDRSKGAIGFPIYQTSTYGQEEPSKHKGFSQARPKNAAAEAEDDLLEDGENALKKL